MKNLFAPSIATAALTLIGCATSANAEWVLDNANSRLSFVTTKAGAAAEVHHFASLQGSVDDTGDVMVTIDLNSVDTAIPIRDERMREMLFETETYPAATLSADLNATELAAVGVGESANLQVAGELALHGIQAEVMIDMTVARLSDSRLLAISRKPIIINASQVGLLEGVERLREVAMLPSISPAVPVTFVLEFEQE